MLTYVDVTLSLINLKHGLSNIFKVIYVVGTGTVPSYFTSIPVHIHNSHCMDVINIGT